MRRTRLPKPEMLSAISWLRLDFRSCAGGLGRGNFCFCGLGLGLGCVVGLATPPRVVGLPAAVVLPGVEIDFLQAPPDRLLLGRQMRRDLLIRNLRKVLFTELMLAHAQPMLPFGLPVGVECCADFLALVLREKKHSVDL